MNKQNIHQLRLLFVALLITLSTGCCLAQNHVRLLHGATFISEASASAADNRLATELPNHDVRISYVASFVEVQDRYKDYEENELLAFAQIPYLGGFTPATQEKKDAAVNAGIHHAISTLPLPSTSTIHIVYAVSVSLNTEGEEEFSSHKYFQFGDEVDRRAKKIVEQIKPDPELAAAGVVSANDTYLTDYVEELIAALNDSGYVVNGTIEYNGESYFDGDTIYLNCQQSEPIILPNSASPKNLKLEINNAYPVNTIVWEETSFPGEFDRNILQSNTGQVVSVRAYLIHFTDFKQIRIKYGEQGLTTIYLLPINLKLDYDPKVIETHTVSPVDITVVNNDMPFTKRGNTMISIVPQAQGNGNNIQIMPGESVESLSWNRIEECGQFNFWVLLDNLNYRSPQSTIAEAFFPMRVKCPKDITSYIAQSYFRGETSNNFRRTESSGDTLHIVRNNNELMRKIEFIVDTDGDVDDYWDMGYSPDEPIWTSRENDLYRRYNGNEKLTHYYDNWTWNSSSVFYDKVEVTAFNQNKAVFVALHEENRNTTTVNHPIKSMIESKIKPRLEKVTEFLQEYINEEFSAELILKSDITTFKSEDEQSRHYFDVREISIDAGLSLTTGKLILAPPQHPVPFPLAGTLPWGLGKWGPFFEFGVAATIGYEYGSQKYYYQPVTSYTAKSHTFQLALSGGMAGGFVVDINAEKLPIIDLEIAAFIDSPTELKGKLEAASDLNEFVVAGEFNHGPITGNLTIVIVALPDSGFDWELVNVNYAYSLLDRFHYPFTSDPFTINEN